MQAPAGLDETLRRSRSATSSPCWRRLTATSRKPAAGWHFAQDHGPQVPSLGTLIPPARRSIRTRLLLLALLPLGIVLPLIMAALAYWGATISTSC